MKKVRVFMIVSVVLILMSTITFAILYHQPDLEYQTIHGDVSALQNIKVNMKINTQRYENSSHASLTFEKGNMHTNIDKKSNIKMMKDLSFDDSVSVYIDYKNAKANSEWKKQDKYKNRTVSQADMVYTIFLPTGLAVYNNQNYHPMNITINPELTMYSNDDYEIIEDLYDESTNSIYRLQDLHDQDNIYAYSNNNTNLIVQDQDDYYFVPYRDAYTKGTSHIYRIYIKDEKAYYEELASLPEHQKELKLYTYNHKLYMIVKKQGDYYFQKYDEKGNFLKEVKLSDKRINYIFIHNHIISIMDEDNCYIVDMDTMKILDQCSLEMVEKSDNNKNVSFRYEDILYKDNTFYFVAKIYGYLEETNVSYTNMEIIAIKGNKELYRGLMKLESKTDSQVYTNYSYVDVSANLE